MDIIMMVSIIGGDLRQITLASLLNQDGYIVKIYGFDKNIDTEGLNKAKDISEAASSDIIILPLPISHDGITLNSPFSASEINLHKLINMASEKTIILGGKVPSALYSLCTEKNIPLYDYFEREELNVLNAIPTAEGAIEIALRETPHTLHKSRCLVIGYGRIGKILADRLKGFGAEITVSARKYSDFAWIETNGYTAADSNNLHDIIADYDIIFNTIPSIILDKLLLEKIPKNTLLIDLASKPGGIDFSLAKELGLKVIWALSLPGKVAPITSGKIIKNTVQNILKEMEES